MEDRVFVVLVIFLSIPFLLIGWICVCCDTRVKGLSKDAKVVAEGLGKDINNAAKDLGKDINNTAKDLGKDVNIAANELGKGVNTASKGLGKDVKTTTESFQDWFSGLATRLLKGSGSNSNIALMPSKSKASDAYRMVSQEDVPFGII